MEPIDPTPAALLDLLPEWELALRAEDKTPGTIEAYLGGTRRYHDWCTSADAVTMCRTSLQTWMAHLLDTGNAPGAVLARKQLVKRFSAWLLATGQLHGDPSSVSKVLRSAAGLCCRCPTTSCAPSSPPAPTRSIGRTRRCTTAVTRP